RLRCAPTWLPQSRLLPNRDLALAVARERVAVPIAPTLAPRHSRQPRHEIELRRPDVAEGCREGPGLAVHEPVVVRYGVLGRDVDLIKAEMPRGHVERHNRLARQEPLPRRNVDFDHELPSDFEMLGDI